ncbi:unnamed protein product [Ostreobium quekettii]|uniref:Uncharacterized protein n=1 Tax=Ostreobium quekettii TaxID=121088 RepID=A0A8S1J775_9CHLO|nr:unnamed protein product [Ostreobium quekettii]
MPSDGQDGRANDGPYDPKIDEGEGRPLGRGEDPQVRRADDDASCSISFGSSPKATGQTSGRESILAASSPQPPSSVGPGWATRTSLLYGDLPESDGTGSHAPPPPQASAEQAPPAAGAAPPVVTHPASEGVGTTQPPQTPVEPGPVFAPADCASTVTPAFLVTSSRLNWVPESVGQPGSGGSEIGRPKEGEGANRDRKPLALNLSQEPGKVCGSSGGQTASQGGRTDDSAAFCTPCSQSDQPTPAMVVYSVRRSKPTEYQITPYRSDSDSEELSKGRKPIPDWCTDQDVLEEEAKAQNKTEKAKLTKLFGAGKMFCNLQELFGREPLTSHNPAKRF